MTEFVMVDLEVEHYIDDSYLIGVFSDGKNIDRRMIGYANGGQIIEHDDATVPEELVVRYHRVVAFRARLDSRSRFKEDAEKMGLRYYHEARKIAHACSSEHYNKILRLLYVKKFRSPFRQSLASQVRAWVDGKSEFASPLSHRQFDALY